MTTQHVLIVEDDAALQRTLRANLTARGFDVAVASSGEDALNNAARVHPDVVILDLGLPGIDGIDVVRGLRAWSRVPIVVLSARDAERSKVEALDAGADDYVTKPFGMDELLARVRSALRRAAPPEEDEVVNAGSLQIDLGERAVRRDGDVVHLTPTEWHVLEVLVRNAGRLVSQKQLLQEVWGPQYETETNYLRLYLAQLRRKLEADPSQPQHLVTEPGFGYRFVM